MASHSRRRHSPERRGCRVAITFTARELARMQQAAQRNGMALAAWIGDGAVERAEGRDGEASGIGAEDLVTLMALQVELSRAGNLLNQSVRRLNATGQRPGRLASHAARCMDVIERADEVIARLRPRKHW
jgi:hypothetical protein